MQILLGHPEADVRVGLGEFLLDVRDVRYSAEREAVVLLLHPADVNRVLPCPRGRTAPAQPTEAGTGPAQRAEAGTGPAHRAEAGTGPALFAERPTSPQQRPERRTGEDPASAEPRRW